MSNSNVNINNFNKIYTTSYIHGEKEDIASAYLGAIDNTPRYNDSTFDYRTYLTRSLGESTTLDNSLFSLEFLYKNKIDSILTDRFKLSFLYDSNRSIENIYPDLEAVKANNSIGIFDLSTCFYTTRYTKRLPLTSTFDDSLVENYINNYCKNKDNISDILNVEDLYSTEQTNWTNISNKYHDFKYAPFGELIYNVENSDKTHIMTFKKSNGAYNSYYVDFTKSDNEKFIPITINNSNNVKFIMLRHGIKDDTKCYALISVNNNEIELYYSENHQNWIKFDELDDNDEIEDKFLDVFNNNYAYKLTDKWNYLNVTSKNISVLNYWEETVNDKTIYLAQIVELDKNTISAQFTSNKTTLMYSVDNINWNPCNFKNDNLLDSPILNSEFYKSVKLVKNDNKFYLYNTNYDIYVKQNDETKKDSVLVSDDLINWESKFNSKYIAYDIKFIDNKIYALTDYKDYISKKCDLSDIDDNHKPEVKIYQHDSRLFDITNNENKIYSFSYIESNWVLTDLFKLGNDIIGVKKDQNYISKSVYDKTCKIYKLNTETNYFDYILSTNSYIFSKGKFIYSKCVSDETLSYDTLNFITKLPEEALESVIDEEKTIIKLSNDEDFNKTVKINNIQVVSGDNLDEIYIYFTGIGKITEETKYIVSKYNNSDSSLDFISNKIYEKPIKVFKKINDKLLISYDNDLYLCKYDSELDTFKTKIYSDFIFGSLEKYYLENIDYITNIDTNDTNDRRYNFGFSSDILVVFDDVKHTIYFKNSLINHCLTNNTLFIPNYYINLDKEDIIEDKNLKNIFIANGKLFALGNYVYYVNTEKMTIKSTKHYNKDYQLYETSSVDPKDTTKYCVIWNLMRYYCDVDVFTTYMSEYPDESIEYEDDEPEHLITKVHHFIDGKLVSEDISYSESNNRFIDYSFSNKYDDKHQVSTLFRLNNYLIKSLVEDKELTKFDENITYYTKDNSDNLIEVDSSITEPETEIIKVPKEVNKVKVDINPATETAPDSSKTYYKLIIYEPGTLTEFEFGQEYYIKENEKFELYDTATNPTPDSNTTYYKFELFEGNSFATDGSVYYTFDATTYTETEYEDNTVTKTYYHCINESISYNDIYVSRNNIDYYRLENYEDLLKNKYEGKEPKIIICSFKDHVILILNNDIYDTEFTENGAYLKNIMSYFNNGKLLYDSDHYVTPYKIFSIYSSSIDERFIIGYVNTYTEKDIVLLSIDDISDKSNWRVSESVIKIDSESLLSNDNTYTSYILDSHYLGLFEIEDDIKEYDSTAYIKLITYPKEVEDFISEVKENYLPYYNFNRSLDKYYLKLIKDYSNYYKSLDKEFISFYDMLTKFGITSDKYNASKMVKLYNFVVEMQEFIAFVISSHEIIEKSIDNYNEIVNKYQNYKDYFYSFNIIPHMYNILYSIVTTRLSKLSSIDENIEVYNYFSKELISNNTSSEFKSILFDKYELIDPINESASTGKIDSTNNNLDKVYSILTQNYDKMMLLLNNYDPDKVDNSESNSYKANKEFIKYLYMAQVTLQIFEVISSVSSQNKSFDTISFDTVMQVLNIDYKKNYSDEEVYNDVINKLKLIE